MQDKNFCGYYALDVIWSKVSKLDLHNQLNIRKVFKESSLKVHEKVLT